MATFAAAFGSSHSVMLVCQEEDWVGKFPPSDKRMTHHDFNGDLISYDELVTKFADHAAPLIAPDAISKRWHKTQATMDHMRDEIQSAQLDALIIVGDDQHELFPPQHNPAIAIYYGETIRNTKARTDLSARRLVSPRATAPQRGWRRRRVSGPCRPGEAFDPRPDRDGNSTSPRSAR